MYSEHTVGVVVPAYNEAGFVGEVIETLPEFVDRVYAVDDCSTDGTWAEIQRAAGVELESGAGSGAEAGAGSSVESSAGGSRASEGVQGSHGSHPSGENRASGTASRDELTDGSGGSAGMLTSDADRSSEATRNAARSSADDAVESAEHTSARAERVVPIRHEENRGVGGAIKTGYQRAREDELDVTVVVGADGQMDPDRMHTLVDPIVDGKADYVTGNRLLNPEHHEEMPLHRVFGNGVLTLLTKIATGYWQVGDPQMGYTAISLEALEDADVDGMYEYFGYCNDLLVRLSTAGVRVADVPCPLHYGDEQSHITYSSYVPRVSSMLLGSFLRRLWTGKDSPAGAARLVLFVGGAVAVAAGLLGAVVGGVRRILASGESASGDGKSSDVEPSDSESIDAPQNDEPASDDAVPSFERGDGLTFPNDRDESDAGGAGVELADLDDRDAIDDRIAADAHEAADDSGTAGDRDGGVDDRAVAADDRDGVADTLVADRDDRSEDAGAADPPEETAEATQTVDAAQTADEREETADATQTVGSSHRWPLAVLGGVAALLAAMLIDATVNATKNYTDTLPEDWERDDER